MTKPHELNGQDLDSRQGKPRKAARTRQDGQSGCKPVRTSAEAPDGFQGVAEDRCEEQPARVPWVSLTRRKQRKEAWLWPGRLAFGTVVVLDGPKAVGKSTIASAIAAALTGGRKLPGQRKRSSCSVLWLTREEDVAGDVRPRIEAAGGDPARVFSPPDDPETGRPRHLYLTSDLDELEAAIKESGAKAVIIDPLSSFVPFPTNLNDEQQARALMENLAQLARRTRCFILLIRHVRKTRGGRALDHGLGSVAIGNVARCVLRADRHPNERGRYVLAVVACNGTSASPSLTYELEDAGGAGRVVWGKEIDLDADELAEGGGDAGEQDERLDAENLLRRRLANGRVPFNDLLAEARAAGIGERTLRTAKVKLGVASHRIGKGPKPYWEWGPPPDGWR